MKKVLFITYAFPPMAGGGIFRITKFLKYLPEFGIEPRVLTVENYNHPYSDEKLLQEIPAEIKITRVNYPDPARWFKSRYWQSFLFYFWYPWFSISDQRVSWIKPAIKEAVKIVKEENIDTIFSSFAPASDHLIAMAVKAQTGARWVADFRDEWASANYLHYPTPLHRARIKELEKKVVMAADKITTVSPPITDYFAKICGDEKKCVTLTNGFDQEDFAGNVEVPKRDYCQILYAGSLYGDRNAEIFNQAVQELNLPDLKVEFLSGENRVSHEEAIKSERQADILLLLLGKNDQPAVFTGKIFEYLAARRPILTLAPARTAAAKLIQELSVGKVVEPDNKEEIKKAILEMHASWQKGELTLPEIDLKPFDRKFLAERLADIFKTFPEKKAKILFVANNRSPQNAKLIEYLTKNGWEIHFVSLDETGVEGVVNHHIKQKPLTPKNGKFNFWFLIQSFFNKYYALQEVKKLIKEIRPDIVHGHGVNFGGILTVFSGFHPNIVTTRGSDVMKIAEQPKFLQYLIKKSLRDADLVTGSSQALKNKSIELGMDPKKFEEVYFGINLEIFRSKDVSHLKQELGLTDEKIIFSARSIKPVYNTDLIVRAAAALQEKNWKMIMLGQNQDEFYLAKIKKLIDELGLTPKIIFLPKVDAHKMADLYNLADVVVSVAQSDGAAVTFMEAMASEAKIVISQVDFIKEWRDGTKFWPVPIGDVALTTRAIDEALATSRADFQTFGEKNRQVIAARAELNASFAKFEKIYRELLK